MSETTLQEERDAACVGLRTALDTFEYIAQFMSEGEAWEQMSRDDLLHLLARTLTAVVNAPEMIRACTVASVPREPETQP